MAAAWAIVTTLKAPEQQVLAFLAHHLALGPDRIWLHFDDPDDPSAAAVEALALERVTVVRCDMAHWGAKRGKPGDRPDSHQRRQVMNLRKVYRKHAQGLDWLAHIDVDEFLVLDRPLDEILAGCEDAFLRIEPFEALHDPALGDDIFSSRYFHRATRTPEEAEYLAPVFGGYADILRKGMLSHHAGKCFFRTGIEALKPAIHSAKLGEERITISGFAEGIALLHFHAQDPERWLRGLQFRLTRGAYQKMPKLREFLLDADDDKILDFYMKVMLARPELLAALKDMGMLRRERLHLKAKVRALQELLTPPAARPA